MSKAIQMKNDDGEKVYPSPYMPIGSIYLSINNRSPAEYFGGTWISFGQGKCLVGVDPNDTDFNSVLKSGGSKYLQSHTHKQRSRGVYGNIAASGTQIGMEFLGTSDTSIGETFSSGSGNSGNLQPYITVYMWYRNA